MTSVSLRATSAASTRSDAVVIGVWRVAGAVVPAAGSEQVVEALGRRLSGLIAALDVSAGLGSTTVAPVEGLGTPLLVMVGLGDRVDAASVREAAGSAIRAVPNATSVAFALPSQTPDLVAATVTGVLLGGYRFDRYRSGSPSAGPGTVMVLTESARDEAVVGAVERATVVAEAVSTVRDWINTPAADLTPQVLAESIAAAAAPVAGLTATVLDDAQLAELGCGGLLGVGAGSSSPPRLVRLEHRPEDAVAHLGLVGKGITFDTGGYGIKTGSAMLGMKDDMSGAAIVAMATVAIARLGLPVQVTALLPLAENMVSGSAYRPGDVLTIYGGMTVEVNDTDSEGRLVMADALALAAEAEPDVILDVATLTDSIVVALGDKIFGVYGTDAVVTDLLDAASAAGEAAWPMPIPEVMSERLHTSRIADLVNTDTVRWGGGSLAAAFLREFTGGRAWGHLDVAGVAMHAGGAAGHLTPGGTGTGLATVVGFAESLVEAAQVASP